MALQYDLAPDGSVLRVNTASMLDPVKTITWKRVTKPEDRPPEFQRGLGSGRWVPLIKAVLDMHAGDEFWAEFESEQEAGCCKTALYNRFLKEVVAVVVKDNAVLIKIQEEPWVFEGDRMDYYENRPRGQKDIYLGRNKNGQI